MSASTASFFKGEFPEVFLDTSRMQQITWTHDLKDPGAAILYTLELLKYSSPTAHQHKLVDFSFW